MTMIKTELTPDRMIASVDAFMARAYGDDPSVLFAGWSDDMIFVLAMARQYAEMMAVKAGA